MHETPGPTATGATVDAMRLTGRGFDGQWYAGSDDDFIQQFGPDREDANTFAYWGILVNGNFTPVGGCQYQVSAGDKIFSVYDAFNGRPFLSLVRSTSVAVNAPLTVTVQRSTGSGDPAPAEGVALAPVRTDAADQTPLTSDPAPAPTTPPRIEVPHLTTGGAKRGLIEARWRVLDAGLRGWTIGSSPAGLNRWTRRAAGTGGERMSFRLAPGRSYDLRFKTLDATTRTITGADRARAGTVALRVLAGRVGVDGVAVAP